MMDILSDSNFWLAVSFAVFMYICWKSGRKPLLNTLDGRIDRIKGELETSENLRVEAQELLAQYERKHRETEKEAKKLIDDAKQHAEKIRAQAEADLADEIARREKQLQDRIERMEEAALQEVRAYASNLALDATASIIQDNMDTKTSQSLVKKSIKDISGDSLR